jgi:hypothetical protein
MRIKPIFEENEDGELVVNRVEAKRIPEYKVLFDRCKPEVGDPEKKKRLRAMRELYYIYLVLDPRSIYYVLPLPQRKVKALQDIPTPEDLPIKEDNAVKAAMDRYEEDITLHPTANAYLASERNLHSLSEDLNITSQAIQDLKSILMIRHKALINDSTNGLTNSEVITLGQEMLGIATNISKLQSDIIKITKDLPNITKTVKELAAAYAEESGKNIEVVGGGTLGNRER